MEIRKKKHKKISTVFTEYNEPIRKFFFLIHLADNVMDDSSYGYIVWL